jgi:hypothetical protein
MKEKSFRTLIRNFVLELIVYGALVVVYFLLVLRYLDEWLQGLFNSNLAVYAVLSLGLVVTQAVILDLVTTFLLDWLNLERLK